MYMKVRRFYDCQTFYLKTSQRTMPASFDFYGNDIENANIQNIPNLSQNVKRALLTEELKMSCTNVLLQCLDPKSQCIFVLGTMPKLNSQTAGEILEITPEAYRQRLSGGCLSHYLLRRIWTRHLSLPQQN